MPERHDTFYFIPHTHWEGAVFKTRDEYLEMGLPNILRALRLLKTCPNYRFTLDQACYVAPFLQRYPEEAAAFRRFVDEGRLAIVGGTDVMLDVNMPGGESFIRQVLYGKGFFRKTLGVEVVVGWGLDTFGHHAQMPQLLTLAGFTSYWFARGVASRELPAEFDWEGLDGTRLPAFWLPYSYALLYDSPDSLSEFTDFVTQRYALLTPHAGGHERVGAAGADVCVPEAHVPALVDAFNAQPERPFDLQLAVPADYVAAVAQRRDAPLVVGGELNPIFQGTYSSRIELKQQTRALETLLSTVESLAALLAGLGVTTDHAELWRAWEPMLFNQAHDLMSGVMTDHVYADTLRGFDCSKRLAQDLLQTRLATFVEHIDTRGEGIPLVVYNTLGAPRSDIVETRISFTDPGINSVTLLAPDGQAVPCQLLETAYYEDGSLLQAQVAFVAAAIPALGYAVYHLLPQTAPAAPATPSANATLENAYYRLDIDRETGAITALLVKDGAWNALRGPANVVALEPDHGDLWELYRPLDACSCIGMTTRHDPPVPGSAVLSTDQRQAPGTVTNGPVISEYSVAHPFSEQGRFQTTIRLYHALPRIEIRTRILNNSECVRYRALFPTALQSAVNTHEIPFGAISRPDGIEFPAQNWIDCSNGEHGVALLNRGLPGNNIADGTLMLSLLRCTSIVAYGYGGGYEPGMGSDSGQELGQELTFDYALLPHAGDWRQAAVYREGQAFNHPLIAVTAAPHTGVLPQRWGALTILPDNVVLSACKVGEQGHLVLRVYEAAGTAVDQVTITCAGTLHAVAEFNLLEDHLANLEATDDRFHFALRPFEIKTFGLDIRFGDDRQ